VNLEVYCLIAGRFDRISIPYRAMNYARYAPQAKLVWSERSGQFPFVEEPQKTMATIEEFMKMDARRWGMR
jgi:proline iminopeptidase